MKEKVLFAWSGGKDSALALHELCATGDYDITALLTTISEPYDRVSMHGIRRTLLEQQAESLGLPLKEVFISEGISKAQYESKMRDVLTEYVNAGVSDVVFGDIFLQDLRKYREGNLSKIGLKAIFPLWKRDTAELAYRFIELGFKSVITCVDSNALDQTFVGRTFNKQVLSVLTAGVDPCGENGEFHSFVYDGPIFRQKIPYTVGEVVFKENRFYCCDLEPIQNKQLIGSDVAQGTS